MLKSVIITAGGTQEKIDTVRSITNHATGRLGSLIADVFTKNGVDVTYLHGEDSLLPVSGVYKKIAVKGVSQLAETMERLLLEKKYDCVIHSMAVSDYTPSFVISPDKFIESILLGLPDKNITKDEIYKQIRKELNNVKEQNEKKINSESNDLILMLKRTPKVIKIIKKLQPQTLLIGFKLLSNVSEHELLKAGLDSIKHNGCDYVVGNDLKDIKNDMHKAILIDKNGIKNRTETKQDIAELLYRVVIERLS